MIDMDRLNEAHDFARYVAEGELGLGIATDPDSHQASYAYERGWDDALAAVRSQLSAGGRRCE